MQSKLRRKSHDMLAKAFTGSEEFTQAANHDYVGFQIQNNRQEKAKLLARASKNLNRLKMARASMTSSTGLPGASSTKYSRTSRATKRSLTLVGCQTNLHMKNVRMEDAISGGE